MGGGLGVFFGKEMIRGLVCSAQLGRSLVLLAVGLLRIEMMMRPLIPHRPHQCFHKCPRSKQFKPLMRN